MIDSVTQFLTRRPVVPPHLAKHRKASSHVCVFPPRQGGLAEALEGLAKGLLEKNPKNKVRLIFPKYSTLSPEIIARMTRSETEFLDDFDSIYG